MINLHNMHSCSILQSISKLVSVHILILQDNFNVGLGSFSSESKCSPKPAATQPQTPSNPLCVGISPIPFNAITKSARCCAKRRKNDLGNRSSLSGARSIVARSENVTPKNHAQSLQLLCHLY